MKGSVARRVNGALGTKGAIWQEGFYDRIAHTLEQLNAYVEYVHKNPCEAGIAGSAEDYPYSSADGSCMDDYVRFLTVAQDER